jgi:Ca2+-binding RTX toxin-like protein
MLRHNIIHEILTSSKIIMSKLTRKIATAILGMTAVLLTVLSNSITDAFAADINCANVVTCVGTTGNGRMAGDNNPNQIAANSGNDQIDGSGNAVGLDIICGGPSDDKINGGSGDDILIGDSQESAPRCPNFGSTGADIMTAGSGSDVLYHGNLLTAAGHEEDSDGHRDIIDCGPGSDEAWINISVDHDVATNCEKIIAG